ncbi:MAG: lysophospholipid acyltransferase family protein [bacterium]|nr:lysophospholipid acyltransferase family protein [bacterium]
MRYFSPFILQTLVWIPTWLVLGFFARFKVFGKENLKGLSHGVIFAANHGSELDPILVPASLNPFSPITPIFYVAREREFYEKDGFSKYIYGGFWFKLWGAYPAHTGKKDYTLSLQEHINILNAGKSILMFPEGGKTENGEVGNGKGGVAFLSHITGVPIVPVAMNGHFKMSPIDFVLRRRKISIKYGKPLYPKDIFPDVATVTIEDYKHAAQLIMLQVAKLHNSSAREHVRISNFNKVPVAR